ncbi:hypothetical protein TD95_002973 [Thielaviopsis punctulata]|uniref:Uncharacterized protein n=1 Tax=Thielaviopsis punctulata TaxID=72032 RepID=A0A0F4ZMG7_9PEZI|nr:hypothetical protein TD95_002973 [Thielaviopsis punctulata]
MHGSPVFKSSVLCATSCDGTHLATLVHNKLLIREVRTLHAIHEVIVSSDVASSAFLLLWAPSSTKILVAATDRLVVYSAFDNSFKAVVKSPASSAARPSHVQFGPTDKELVVVSQFGLRLALVNLVASSAIEIAHPKFGQPRGFSFRAGSKHLALLTRFSGKDCISIHTPESRAIDTSFYPDTIDAQGVAWVSNGRWLAVWESPAQGHKVLLYTPDGHLFNTWTGPPDNASEPQHYDIGAGVKHCHLDASTMKAALCDYTRAITILDLSVGHQLVRLVHPQMVIPVNTLQVWQEQQRDKTATIQSSFMRTTHAFSPPERKSLAPVGSETIPGCLMAEFDSSSNLLATVVEEYRSTLWIWDLTDSDLRAVVLFHGSISRISWHPQTPELLLITTAAAEGGPSNAAYVWDPLSEGPRAMPFPAQPVKPGKAVPRLRAHWVAHMTEPPVVLLNDGSNGTMVALSEEGEQQVDSKMGNDGLWENAVLTAKVLHKSAPNMKLVEDVEMTFTDDGTTKLDDTFFFKGVKPSAEGGLREKPKGNPLLQKAHLRK